jgi:F-type H+-transporting ATPase subunit delta
MKDRAAASRYARALEGALEGDAEFARASEELTAIGSIFAQDPATAAAICSPALAPEQRKALLDTLTRSLGLSGKAAALVALLSQHEHLALLPEIASAFAAIRDRRLGIVEAEVTTAVAMSGELAERTKQMLERTTGKKIRLSLKTDAALIGGLVAKVGSTVYDGSVKTRLDTMRTHLVRG